MLVNQLIVITNELSTCSIRKFIRLFIFFLSGLNSQLLLEIGNGLLEAFLKVDSRLPSELCSG